MNDENAMAKAANVVAENEAPRAVVLKDGKTVKVIKCKVKSIGPVLGLVNHVFKTLSPNNTAGDFNIPEIKQSDILQLIATSSDKLMVVVSNLCSMSKKELDELELDDAIAITSVVWEVNKDFFLQQVLPMINKILPTVSQENDESEKE